MLPDAARLTLGTLTAVPVAAPRRVDRRVAGWAMALAPAVGLLLAAVVAAPLGLAAGRAEGSPLLLACLAVGALALLTRAMHLDGLADTADGLGSGRPAPGALEVMRASDVGPFGVATLVLVLLVQVAALASALSVGVGGASLVVALVTGRLALALACLPAFPAARPDGLGATVAGSLRPAGLAVAVVTSVLACVVLGAVSGGGGEHGAALLAGLLGVVPALLLARHCVRRLGGLTGDVHGAVVEVGTTGALVATVLALP
nr:adenosylcobinamide-GDP ribazoletransferase [Nocardioides perillae]